MIKDIYWFCKKLYDRYLRKKDTSLIPEGIYCYTRANEDTEACPYWDIREDKHYQLSGYCAYLAEGDWEENASGLLWDACKECRINEYSDEEWEKQL